MHAFRNFLVIASSVLVVGIIVSCTEATNESNEGTPQSDISVVTAPTRTPATATAPTRTPATATVQMDMIALGLGADFDPSSLPLIFKSDGAVLKAYIAAYEAFSVDELIPDQKRNVENYDLEFRQNDKYFFVYFAAHLSESDKANPSEGGETSLGKSVMFIVGKNDFAVKRRYFFA